MGEQVLSKKQTVLMGRRVGNRSLKVIEAGEQKYLVCFSTYLLRIPIIKKQYCFNSRTEAEVFYDKLTYLKFKGLV